MSNVLQNRAPAPKRHSLTGGSAQQLQTALQANAETVREMANIRMFNTARIPEKPWLSVLRRKTSSQRRPRWWLCIGGL